jgi:hypothetical protein
VTAYLLDNNILSYFWNQERERDLGAASQRVEISICEEVRDEAAKHLGSAKLQTWLNGTHIKVQGIELGSKAHTTLAELHPDMSILKDLGERASIALCAHDPSFVFVANDKKALWLALRELHVRGERIVGLLVFLRRLHEDAGLSPDAMDAIVKISGHGAPTWWRDFRAPLRAKAGRPTKK